MTNKEAIEFIEIDISRLWNTPQNLKHKEALEMARDALKQKSYTDAISRQAVLDLPRIKTHNQWGNVIKESVDVEDIRRLSSVTLQEPKTDVLDKIRAEIEQTSETVDGFLMHDGTKRTVLQIIDKYKAETE